MRGPDFARPFILQTDASERGVGAVLTQYDDVGTEHPMANFSQKLLSCEEKYSAIENECLAVKLACRAFRVYLLGRPFTVQTDHRALEWIHRLRENNTCLMRWSLTLQPFQFEVQHWAGHQNSNADTLFRAPPDGENARQNDVAEEGGGGVRDSPY